MAGKRPNPQIRMDFDHRPIEQPVIDKLVAEMAAVYLSEDDREWVIGFSGGKDSSAVVQLVVLMLMILQPQQRTKKVYILSSDTLVENPAVAIWLEKCHEELRQVAAEHKLPIEVVMVRPDPEESFWVCLIGRGYPAPTKDFRWCTSRLKIDPAEAFIILYIHQTGRILQLLGSRKAESKNRGKSIEAHALEKDDGTQVKEPEPWMKGLPVNKFGKAGSLADGYTYQPIQEWDNDNVWEYLRLFPKPWGPDYGEYNNQELFDIYQDAHGGECVLEFDRRTASCGSSRFGCFVCTVVPDDLSMMNMVAQVTPEYAPLLAFRQKIKDYREDRSKRDPIGRNGRLRLNSLSRLAAAKVHAGEWPGGDRYKKAFEAGTKWRPDDSDGLDQSAACELCAQRLVSPVMDAAAIRQAFNEGIAWAAIVEVFQAGARRAEQDRYKPSGKTAAEMAPEGDAERTAWLSGAEWSRAALEAGIESPDVTPGPYLLEVRAEFLRDLFEIEKVIPGFRTITDTDLHWIKHWWDHDGGDPGIVDRLVAEYRGGGGTTA